MTYVWDTNIFIKSLRNRIFLSNINDQYDCFGESNELLVSAVTVGELYAFALRNRWGSRRITEMAQMIKLAKCISVTDDMDIIEMYADIDVYSQSKHPILRLPTSARKMGKNDLWIAATTALNNATLLSSDGDFDHLQGVFLSIVKIPD